MLFPDGDGQDFSLTLYDQSCNVISSSPALQLLAQGLMPKGQPHLVAALPATYTGTYYIEVARVVGAGNYVLVPYAGSAIPTLPLNDAFTGAPASHNCTSPTPLPVPDGVFQGRFEDGDTLDCYSVTIGAGDVLSVNLLPSPANTASLTVKGGGTVNTDEDALGHGEVYLTNRADTAQTVILAFSPTLGGGNYMFSVAHGGAVPPQ